MTHWILFVAPLAVASFVMLFAFTGCFLDSVGEHPDPPRTTYKNEVLSHPNVSSYWQLGEAAGETVAIDSNGGDPGTYVGGVVLGEAGLVTGDPDTAALFDGSTGHVDLPVLVDVSGPFTIECLVRPVLIEGVPTIVSQRDGDGTGRTLLFVDESGNFASNLGGTIRDSGFTAAVDTTNHLAFTYAGGADGTWIFYVDGIQTATGTATGEPATGGWLIGANKTLAEFWNGIIDEVAIYNAAIESGAILAHSVLALTGEQPDV